MCLPPRLFGLISCFNIYFFSLPKLRRAQRGDLPGERETGEAERQGRRLPGQTGRAGRSPHTIPSCPPARCDGTRPPAESEAAGRAAGAGSAACAAVSGAVLLADVGEQGEGTGEGIYFSGSSRCQ